MTKIVIFIVLFSFLTPMSYAMSILLTNEVSLTKVDSLSSYELNDDIDLLLSTLDKAYGGKNILSGKQ
ncbi:MAG: hypothetical protein KDD45_15485 [Bdellovibrionales bacterium]|nr:hypothetical protein [Bdellovibrionales bacterium]